MQTLTLAQIAAIEADPLVGRLAVFDATGFWTSGDLDHVLLTTPGGRYALITRRSDNEQVLGGKFFETEEDAWLAWSRIYRDLSLLCHRKRNRAMARTWEQKQQIAIEKAYRAHRPSVIS